MNPSRRRAWVAAGVFGVACLGWLFHVPYRAERVLSPIPAQASWVSLHRDPAERWDRIAGNPALGAMLRSAGVADPLPEAWRARLSRWAGREVAVAYLPHLPPDGGPGWVVVSWVGAWSHWLRWGLTLHAPDGLARRVWSPSQPYWTGRWGPPHRPRHVSFALEEGLLIGCIGTRPESIGALLACFNGTAPSWLSLGEAYTAPVLSEVSPDRGLYRAAAGPVTRVALEEISPARIAVRWTRAGGGGGVAGETAVVPDVAAFRWFGDLPVAVAAVSAPALRAVAAARGSEWADAARLCTDVAGATAATVALFGGEYSGRLHGLRVPAVAVAFAVRDEAAAARAAEGILIRAGAALGIPFLPESGWIDEVRVIGVSAPGHGGYGELPAEERAAYAIVDGWLVASSHRANLVQLLRRREWAAGVDRPGGDPGQADGLWGGLHPAAPASMSCRLPEAGQALRNALAVYRLNRMKQGGGNGPEQWEAVRDIIAALQELASARGWVEQEGDAWIWRLELGSDDAP